MRLALNPDGQLTRVRSGSSLEKNCSGSCHAFFGAHLLICGYTSATTCDIMQGHAKYLYDPHPINLVFSGGGDPYMQLTFSEGGGGGSEYVSYPPPRYQNYMFFFFGGDPPPNKCNAGPGRS